MSLFDSPKLLAADARKQIDDLKAVTTSLKQGVDFEIQTVNDYTRGRVLHKAKLLQSAPTSCTLILFHAVTSLYSALDHAIHASVETLTGTEAASSAFHFQETEEKLLKRLSRDSAIHEKIKNYIAECRPYPGGDDNLSALNHVRNRKTHRYLIHAEINANAEVYIGGPPTSITPVAERTFELRWDFGPQGVTMSAGGLAGPGSERVLVSAPVEQAHNVGFQPRLSLTFSNTIPNWGGKELVSTLLKAADRVDEIVAEVERRTTELL